MRSTSIFSGVFWLVKRRRVESRFTWVSTTTPSSIPKAFPRITLAVLRPTPGNASSAARSSGTLPPCCSTSAAQVFNGARPRDLNQLYADTPNIAINLKTAELIGLYAINPNARK